MYCENCGTKLSDDAKFCRNCGSKVKDILVTDGNDAGMEVPIIAYEEKVYQEDYITAALFGSQVKIGSAVVKYYKMKEAAKEQAEKIQQEAREYYYNHYDKITSFEDKCDMLLEAGDKACEKMREYCYNLLFELGIYEYSLSSFLDIYGSRALLDRRYSAFLDKLKDKLREMDQEAIQKYAGRELRKASRGRFVGGGFGISGAVGGALQAGFMNVATGLAHSAVNAIGNVATAISTNSSKEQLKRQLLQDDSVARDFFMELWDSLKVIVEGAFERYEDIAYEEIHSVSKECEDKAGALLSNLEAGRIPEDKRKNSILEGIEEDPTNKGFYVYILCNFPKEYENLRNVIGILDIKIEEVIEYYLADADLSWKEKEFEYFSVYDRKEYISIEDVEEYKKKLDDNYQCVENALSALRLPEDVITESFIETYVRETSDCHIVDDQYRKMKCIGIDQEFNVFSDSEYVLAKTYDDFIIYLKDKEKIIELCNKFKTTELQRFAGYDWEDLEFDSGIDTLTVFQNGLVRLAEEIQEASHAKECTDELVCEIKEQAAGIDPLVFELKEQREKNGLKESKNPEEKKKRFEEICSWIFADVGFQYGDRVTVYEISPKYHSAESVEKAFGCNLNVEKPLIAFDYNSVFEEGFLITNKKIHMKNSRKGITAIRNEDICDVIYGKDFFANTLYFVDKEGKTSAPVYLSGMNDAVNMTYRLHLLYSMTGVAENAAADFCSNRENLVSEIVCYLPPSGSSMLVRGKMYIPSGNAKLQKMKTYLGISEAEKVFALLDSSLFGSCKVGLVVGYHGVIFKSGGGTKTRFLAWNKFKDAMVQKGVSSIKIDEESLSCNVGAEQESVYGILKNLQTAVKLFPDLFEEKRKI